jgi:glycine/D-amino acid oxidase-like deaminating enzyme
MPTQSNVIVTRPLTGHEIKSQGWNSAQMAYDTRNLLHYFRLMPDGRFLFGMRGGLRSSPRAEAASRRAILRGFSKMFPAWKDVEVTHSWSGMVSIARDQLPYVGPVPNMGGVFAGVCYHGNGIAMGSYAGKKLAQMVLKNGQTDLPEAMTTPLTRFPFGRARRLIMPAVYAGLKAQDLV